MKKFLILITSLILFISCEDVVDIDLPTAPERLVIDASIERQFSTEEGIFDRDVATVNLSLTTPFFKEERNFVNDAEVSLTNMKDNISYNLENIGSLGNYSILDSGFKLEENIDYKLTINYKDEVYESVERMTISTPFKLIKQISNEDGFDEDGVAAEIAFNDIKDSDSFYFLDLGDTNFVALDDEFFTDGEEIKFTYFFDENVTLKHLFKIYGSTKRFNTFIDAIGVLSGGDSNGPFGTVPFKAKGNIVNKTNKENFPFGYFRVSEVYTWPIEFVPNKDFKEPSLNQ